MWSDQINAYQRPVVPGCSEVELEIAFTSAGITKNERWAIEETLRERGQKPTAELIWFWAQKLRNREAL